MRPALALITLMAVAASAQADQFLVSNTNGTIDLVNFTGKGNGFTASSSVYLNLGPGHYPDGMAFGPNGDLYYSDLNTGDITRYNPASGASTVIISRAGGGPAYAPQLVFAPGTDPNYSNDLLVADYQDNRVLAYKLGGAYQGVYASGGGLSGPVGMAFDSSGNFYVASSLNNTFLEFPAGGGQPINSYSAPGNPAQLTYHDGYVLGAEFANSDTNNPGLDFYDETYKGNETFNESRLAGIAADSSGFILAAEAGTNAVSVFKIYGDQGGVYGLNNYGHFALPAGSSPLSIVDVPSSVTLSPAPSAELAISAVPEPSSLALAGLGALGLIGMARRRRAT